MTQPKPAAKPSKTAAEWSAERHTGIRVPPEMQQKANALAREFPGLKKKIPRLVQTALTLQTLTPEERQKQFSQLEPENQKILLNHLFPDAIAAEIRTRFPNV